MYYLTSLDIRSLASLSGAGYDTRAYRFAEKRRHPEFKGRLSYTSVIEIDQPSVQQRKRKLLVNSFNKETLSYVEKYVIYIPCTFDDHNTLLRALDRNPEIDPNLNTLFIMEGSHFMLSSTRILIFYSLLRCDPIHHTRDF